MHGDLRPRPRPRRHVLEHDHGPAGRVAVAAVVAPERRAGRGEHRHGEVVPVRERVLALGVGHLLQVVAVALGERGDRRPERGVGQQVVGRGHGSSYLAAR